MQNIRPTLDVARRLGRLSSRLHNIGPDVTKLTSTRVADQLPLSLRSITTTTRQLERATTTHAGSVPNTGPDARSRLLPAALGAAFGMTVALLENRTQAEQPVVPKNSTPPTEKDKKVEGPVYTRAEVAKHTTPATGIWVTYKDGVYDITEFVANHPGGSEKIMLAAGKAVDPYWQLYQQHLNSKLPLQLLGEMRIGTLDPSEAVPELSPDDPYAGDPARHPALLTHSSKPCNAESPLTLTLDSWITPVDLWFVRHHHPVPAVEPAQFVLVVGEEGEGGAPKTQHRLSLQDLKKFPRHEVTTTIQCGGNRRSGLNEVRKTSGTAWGCGAISTATWAGASLRDVCRHCGIDEATAAQHIHFAAADDMAASIPVEKALSPFGDCLLAYEMNGEPLARDHGGPLRAIVPGHVGVRNVKWVSKVTASGEEARGMWNRGLAYKIFSPTVASVEGRDLERDMSMQEMNVQSAIVQPQPGALVEGDEVTCRGFAWSGGGRGIAHVDVSADGGRTWRQAQLTEGAQQKPNRAWAWTFWEVDLPVPPEAKGRTLEICCKATDAASNTQPESGDAIWNLRGLGNNSWHRVQIKVDED